jgi:hypothetical protein
MAGTLLGTMTRSKTILLVILVAGLVVGSRLAWAQDDGPSLGEFARNMRKAKTQQPPQQVSAPTPPPSTVLPARMVIDNDNLTQVMQDVEKKKPLAENKTVLSVDSAGNSLKVSSPDVTCSMSFNARASALLVKPALIEELPVEQLIKLDGPASIQQDNLQLEVFNGTGWELREVTVGLTLERRPGLDAAMEGRARVLEASKPGRSQAIERHSDVTLLYHLKTSTKPFSAATLRQNIGITPGPDENWRWSIVEAKGIAPTERAVPESLKAPLRGSAASPIAAGDARP